MWFKFSTYLGMWLLGNLTSIYGGEKAFRNLELLSHSTDRTTQCNRKFSENGIVAIPIDIELVAIIKQNKWSKLKCENERRRLLLVCRNTIWKFDDGIQALPINSIASWNIRQKQMENWALNVDENGWWPSKRMECFCFHLFPSHHFDAIILWCANFLVKFFNAAENDSILALNKLCLQQIDTVLFFSYRSTECECYFFIVNEIIFSCTQQWLEDSWPKFRRAIEWNSYEHWLHVKFLGAIIYLATSIIWKFIAREKDDAIQH